MRVATFYGLPGILACASATLSMASFQLRLRALPTDVGGSRSRQAVQHFRLCQVRRIAERLQGRLRYADDLVVLCRWKPPEVYMPKLRQFLARLRVTVNEDKTRVVDAQDNFDFLGVHFRKQPSRRDARRWFCYCWPSQKSMQRIRDKVKAAIGRDNRPSVQEKLERLNPILRGWSAYFGWLNSARHFRKVDQYVTWKLRRWLQAKHQRRRRAFWRTPLAYWRTAGLYSTQGRVVHTS